MVRSILRALGFVLLAASFAALVIDGSRSVAGGRLLQASVGEMAAWLDPARYGAAMGALAGWPAPIAPLAAGLAALPAWIVAAALGVALLQAGRPPADAAGFSGRGA